MQGSIDIPLDEVGLWQVNQSAQSLIKLYVLPDPSRHQLVVSSDLERSMQTAHAFADRLVRSACRRTVARAAFR
ncbi:MAG: histidine phosphatase family protein [Bifidobacterium animalis]